MNQGRSQILNIVKETIPECFPFQIVVVAVYLISLINFCDGEILQSNIYLLDGPDLCQLCRSTAATAAREPANSNTKTTRQAQ